MSSPESKGPTPSRRSKLARRVLAFGCWGYLVILVLLWYALTDAESWWPATILMFSPRWVFATPLLVLLPIALYRRSLVLAAVVLVAVAVAMIPVAGFNVPWHSVVGSRPKGMPYRVATLNMHYAKGNEATIQRLIDSTWPDVVAIQEWSGKPEQFLTRERGWHTHATSRLFVASRHPIRKAVELDDRSGGWRAPAAHYELETPDGVMHVFSIHTATSRDGISETLRDYRRGEQAIQTNSNKRLRQSEYIASQARACTGPVIVLGDFNTPPESPIFAETWRGYTDAFGRAGWGFGYTFIGAKTTVRIDHVLVNQNWGIVKCWVGPNVGSPHRPVIADLVRLEN